MLNLWTYWFKCLRIFTHSDWGKEVGGVSPVSHCLEGRNLLKHSCKHWQKKPPDVFTCAHWRIRTMWNRSFLKRGSVKCSSLKQKLSFFWESCFITPACWFSCFGWKQQDCQRNCISLTLLVMAVGLIHAPPCIDSYFTLCTRKILFIHWLRRDFEGDISLRGSFTKIHPSR